MEHSFKRRRLSPRTAGSTKPHRFRRHEMVSDDEEASEATRPKLKSRSYGSLPSPKLFADRLPYSPKHSNTKKSKLSALHPRNFVPTQATSSVQPPTKTVISSVVQVIVNDGNGDEVTELLVPVKTSVISLSGFAPITLANKPAPTSSSPNTPGYQNASPTRPAASSSKAAQTIEVQATRTPSIAASSSAPASSTSMTISFSGAQSQAVLSSPPSTPLPSSPSSSLPPGSTGSYFPSSIEPTSSSGHGPVASETANGQPSPAFAGGNSTTTAIPSSTFAETSTFGSAIFTTSENSTLITSTRSSSSQTSGVSSTPSVPSAGTTTSLSSSISSSGTASQTQSSSSASLSSSFTVSSTGVIIGGGGSGGSGGTAGTGSAPSPTASTGSSPSSSGSPSTPAVVGGVVGGVAGLAIILLLLIFILRRRRAKSRQPTISPPNPQTVPPATATGATTERSSVVPFASSAFLRRIRPGSGQTVATTDTGPSERGFQNMGGRKLESVLFSRGDGYSDPVPTSGVAPRNYGGTAAGLGLAAGVAQPGAFRGAGQGPSPGPSEDETLSGSSFYRDSQGFYGGPEGEAGPSAPPTAALGGLSPEYAGGPGNADQEIAVTRPSPARTPVISQPGFAPFRQPPGTGRWTPLPGTGRGTPPPRTLTPQLRQQDDVGRSHPSFDGSRGSRFAEEL